jgi:ABC-type microcin C transport system permease subunit YejE
MGVPIGPKSLSYAGTDKSSRAILWALITTLKLSRFGIDNFYTDSVGIALVTLQGLFREMCRVPLTVHQMSSVSCHRFSRAFRRNPRIDGKIVTHTSCTNWC